MESSDFFAAPLTPRAATSLTPLSQSGFNALYTFEREGKRFVVKALGSDFRGNLLYESLLRKEFEIGYSLEHPNICRTYSFEEFEELGCAIVMEWLDGRTLNLYLAEKSYSQEELCRITYQLCDAVAYAHKRQIIHRDLKPQNIIITHNGDNVKLLDFGLSDTDRHTTLKEPAGSRKYASPELQRGGNVDSRTDIYSLGIIIDEIFEGHKSLKISKIVSRATAFYPTARYADADSVADAVRGRKIKIIYPILIIILAVILPLLGYLFYALNHASQALIPSAQADRVTAEEFDRRVALSNDFYREINNSYLTLMNEQIYRMNCSTVEMPDFEELSREQLRRYDHLLDSMMGTISHSTLYITARRNMSSHNSELFTIMRNSFPSMFWINTERLYRQASDSLALRLKEIPSPSLSPSYGDLSSEEQRAEDERYRAAEREYKRATVEVWAKAYRLQRDLAPLPAEIFE